MRAFAPIVVAGLVLLSLPSPLARASGDGDDGPHEPWADASVEAGNACRKALADAGVTFRALPDREKPDAKGCGIPHAVMIARGPTGIRYDGALMVDCGFALELPAIERVIQDEAEKTLGAPITRVATLGTYSCRGKRGFGRPGLSEHAFGNAVDVAGFVTKKNVAVTVAHDYPKTDDATSPKAAFLLGVQRRLRAETRLTRVIGPDWDPVAHRDHFHLDRGRPWWMSR